MPTPQEISCKALSDEMALQVETREPEFNFNFERGKAVAARFQPIEASEETKAEAQMLLDQISNWQDGLKDLVTKNLQGINAEQAWQYAVSKNERSDDEKHYLYEMKVHLLNQ